ncbi:sensor histidine kinase [Nocardioides mangrovicus]|uniref:histidine kinase n=1 Tax=Nocardioides mangrovicus TaxID=2478913 RepID=A0A3L8NZL2_9ACTN|nr:HAMP domain-containing sensor histidine kinase [Nocardioides mangrovicus]RLV47739.1 sensor histidine kinase [Nocardioides mangrovicus]
MRSHVRTRVTAVATLVALVAAVVGSLVFLSVLRSALESSLVGSAEQDVASIQARLREHESPRRAVLSGKNDLVVQVTDADHHVVATDHPQVTRPLRRTVGQDRGVRFRGLSDPYVVVARDRPDGHGLIIVARSSEHVGSATTTVATLLAVSVPVGLLLIAGGVWLTVGRALRPVEDMRREAASITADRLDRRLAVPPGADEIPRLAATLNQMLDRIDAGNRQQRQFVSDASHELRSPLATIRQLAEVAERYPDRVSTAELARDVLAEELRMEDLVSALLILARADDAPAGPAAAPVDLDDVVLHEVRRVPIGSVGAGIDVDASAVTAGQVVGDTVLLGQVVRNLLSNAVRHARSRVVVTLGETEGQVVLTVADDGEGIAPDERERVFERFVRLDEARARDAGGSGLGLAIVTKVVTGAGGTVRVEDTAQGGACFVVSLPAA